jgi:Rieske Fe-S protein
MGLSGLVSATLRQTRLYSYSSYVLGATVPAGTVPDALYWDTSDPYFYLRLARRGPPDYVIFGGEDHKTGQEHGQAAYQRLQRALLQRLPMAHVQHRWSGQVVETNDGVPFIGEVAPQQFLATGFAGNGMTFGTLSAMMAADAFEGRSNPWSELFSPKRKKLKGGTWSYLKENADYPYYLLRSRLAGAERKSVAGLRRHQGAILNVDGKKVAAYRDGDGRLFLRSPVCTHLGCIVAWNRAEQTWDCPCHGSRFRPTGEVLTGPAEQPLEELK